MSRRQLTQKQHAFLEFLRAHVREHKVWPTYREIVDHFSYRSPNSVTQNLQALTKKGFLRRDYNGYHLVERGGKEGTVPLRGTVRDGAFATEEAPDHLSLSALFPNVTGLHALRLDGTLARTPALRDAQYVFVADGEAASGDLAVVLHDGTLTLRTVGADGTLADPDGASAPLRAGDAEVLGRFAGHAGPYGLVRHALHVFASDAEASFS
jgi:repressor LexA